MIHDPNFSLDPGPAWRQASNDDPEQYNLLDDARDIAITLSAIALDIAPGAIEQFANVLVDSRLRGEGDAAQAFDHHATIYEPIIVPRAWGLAVAYYGHDDTGRQFSFAGSVTRHCVISLYASSGKLSQQELFEAMDEVASKLEFDRTPLAGEDFAD